MKHVLPILAFLVSLSGHADQDQTFEAASELARTNVRGAFDGISGASAEGVVPKYGVVPPEAQYFQGGRGNTQDHGVAKIQSCANYSPGQDKIANQECEVVNFLARNPDIRPQFDLGNKDPMISNNRDKRERAQDVFETLGVNNATSDCTTSTETNPAKYATKSCVSIHGVETHQCLLGREIDIDADANFECEKTISAFTSETRALSVTTQSCTYGREIYIDEDSNFLCDKTMSAYEELKCRKRLIVTPSNQLTIPPVIKVYQLLQYNTPTVSYKYRVEHYVTIRSTAPGSSVFFIELANSSLHVYGDGPSPATDRFDLRLTQSDSSHTISCASVSKTTVPDSHVVNGVSHYYTHNCHPATVSLNRTERLGVEVVNQDLPQSIYDYENVLSVTGYQKLTLLDANGAYIPHGTLLAHTIDSGCNGTLRIDNIWGATSAMCGYGAWQPWRGEFIVTDTFTLGANAYSGMKVKFLFDPMIGGQSAEVSWADDCAILANRSQ